MLTILYFTSSQLARNQWRFSSKNNLNLYFEYFGYAARWSSKLGVLHAHFNFCCHEQSRS